MGGRMQLEQLECDPSTTSMTQQVDPDAAPTDPNPYVCVFATSMLISRESVESLSVDLLEVQHL